jgi:hypothetical protein
VALLGVPGYFVVGLLTHHYVMALTDRRLIVARVKGGLLQISFEPKVVKAYSFEELAALPIETAVSPKVARISIGDPMTPPLCIKFRRGASPGNRANTEAMAVALRTLKEHGIEAMRPLLPESAPKSRRPPPMVKG